MSPATDIVEAVAAMGRDQAVLLSLLAAHYPAWQSSEYGPCFTVVVDLPTGRTRWEVDSSDSGLFHDLELYTGGELGPQTPFAREIVVHNQTRALVAARPRVPCPAKIEYGSHLILSCVRDRHTSGNHEDPDGRDWWVQPTPSAAGEEADG